MTERGIIFSAPMVRAILAGRKTVTRRIVTVPYNKGTRCLPYEPYYAEKNGRLLAATEGPEWLDYERSARCPYGVVGDRLWVRETAIIAPARWNDGRFATHTDNEGRKRLVQHLATEPCRDAADDYGLKATPSIFMPRWASRITLEVTGVRVERLQEITDEDARAEGVCHDSIVMEPIAARSQFATLWDAINGKRAAWASNPWVWRIEFRRAA